MTSWEGNLMRCPMRVYNEMTYEIKLEISNVRIVLQVIEVVEWISQEDNDKDTLDCDNW